MAAPDKSLRPKSRPDESNERKASEAFGDLEFRADLDETLKDDPISRLGFTLTKDSTYFGGSSSPNIGKSGNRLGAAYSGRHNEVFMSDTYGSSKDAYSHEYRHAGFDVLRKLHNEDPVAFENMYGKDAALLLDEDVIREELVAELLDNPDASYMSEGKELPLSDTIQYVNPEKLRDAKEKGYYSTDSFRYGDIYTKGVSGLKMAAQDLLFESGEPSKYQDLSTGPKDRKGKRGAEEEGILSGFFKRIGFNEGGSVGTMDAQMKLFEEGGLTDDGTTMDPVSGNEVPPGSLPEEVRDDIPAMLSEGEYVVPADVLRFYGVKFFEDLRKEAKMGWSEMEDNGRIGGEPAEPEGMEMGGDDFPFDLEELQVVEAAEGGYMGAYAPGGLVDNRLQYRRTETPQASTEYRSYTNGSNTIQVLFMDGIPINQIPTGYYPVGQEPEQDVTETTAGVERARRRDDDDDDRPRNVATSNWYDKYDLKSSEGVVAAVDDLLADKQNIGTKILGNVLGPVAGMGVGLMQANDIAKAKGIVALIQKEDAELAAQLQTKIDLAMDDSFLAETIENINPNLIDGSDYVDELGGLVSLSGGSTTPAVIGDAKIPTKDNIVGDPVVDTPVEEPFVEDPVAATASPETPPPSRPSRDNEPSAMDKLQKQMADNKAKREAEIKEDVASYSAADNIAEAGRAAAPSTARTTNTGSGSGGTATMRDSVSAKDEDDPRNMNKGGLIKRRKKKKQSV